ncbi:hypothetical protein TIN4_71 [Tsukamurella phage TIN4]|uniref:Uncharacterized protein n=2 Tax=Tinduovirus TIN3 TaxID=1982571 RepID=A0A0K0N6C9_9CAUD|nr:hypothetical protein AVT54_gp054 [Tsukamurella phage TIN3]YP_009604201.1 hypothetical protein FDH87_gp054 [Tsukamurella phage TIN4]AKJ71868.1 hypothetical protein TIN3_71 [Tsukamurella phage TIN3]AKJ71977.1 hypothetical protein TIN4_71 [Tsukamurella phage TIN4]
MSAPTTELELTDYDGKRVELKLVGSDEYVTGTVASSSPEMIAFKEKGKSHLGLVKHDEIEDIRVALEAEPEMKARRLNLVNLDTVKRHLVDRHGYSLADINSMTPEDALAFHDGLNHEPLSHFHADPPAKKDNEDGGEDE